MENGFAFHPTMADLISRKPHKIWLLISMGSDLLFSAIVKRLVCLNREPWAKSLMRFPRKQKVPAGKNVVEKSCRHLALHNCSSKLRDAFSDARHSSNSIFQSRLKLLFAYSVKYYISRGNRHRIKSLVTTWWRLSQSILLHLRFSWSNWIAFQWSEKSVENFKVAHTVAWCLLSHTCAGLAI